MAEKKKVVSPKKKVVSKKENPAFETRSDIKRPVAKNAPIRKDLRQVI